MSTIKFLKVRDVKSPSRANKLDAGIDFYVPELTREYIEFFKEKNPNIEIIKHDLFYYIKLKPQERVLLPSGIHCQMSEPGRALIAANKSGVSTKTGLIFGAQVVDYEYRGEIHLSLINTSNSEVILNSNMKILQFLEMPVFNSEILISEMSVETFYRNSTTRGADGFGSTDKN
jgi:dUTP pyrophosphatase